MLRRIFQGEHVGIIVYIHSKVDEVLLEIKSYGEAIERGLQFS